MKKVDGSPIRVLDVIQSCTTLEQLQNACKYANLWARRASAYSFTGLNEMIFIFSNAAYGRHETIMKRENEEAKNNHAEAREEPGRPLRATDGVQS